MLLALLLVLLPTGSAYNISLISCLDAACSLSCQLVQDPLPLDTCIDDGPGRERMRMIRLNANKSISFLTYHETGCLGTPTVEYCRPSAQSCPTNLGTTPACISLRGTEWQMYTTVHYPHTCSQYSQRCEIYQNGTDSCCRASGSCDVAYEICD